MTETNADEAKISVMEWGRADQGSLGFDILFPHGGPVLTLTPQQAQELLAALSDALAATRLSNMS